MKLRACFVVLALVPFAARGIEQDETRTFPIGPGCALQVELGRGAIDVEESDTAEIAVTAHLDFFGATQEQANHLRAALALETRQEGNTVIVRAADPAGHGVRFSWNDNPPVDLQCTIRVPRRCDVDLRTHDGGITVGSLTGRVVVRAFKGNLFLRRITGTVDVATQTGDVTISRCTGDVVARTGHGTLRVGTLGSRAVLRNTGGDIEVLQAHAGLDAVADVGDVTIGLPKDFRGGAKVRTAYGSIFAKIDPTANCAVQASSFWGHVENRLPLVIESGGDGKSKLEGRLNAGGPIVTLHANGGHVFLKQGDTYFN